MKVTVGFEMPDTKLKLLIVDDESSIRTSLSCLLTEIGYCVRTADDGFSALAEIRTEIPDIVLSDLNMPRMSGFELLSVVRRRFPSVQTIAMSGAFSGNEVPSGVAAHGFYQKGSSMGSLLKIIGSLPQPDRSPQNHAIAPAPIWIERKGEDNSGEDYATISCPECLRTFSQPLGGPISSMRETDCIFCSSSIHFASAQPTDRAHSQAKQTSSRESYPGSYPQPSC
jgi:CheY-like chemotaxis protein